MKSLDDVTAPQDGLRFWSWATTRRAMWTFKTEFAEPVHSRVGLLEAIIVDEHGNEYILAPGSRRLLFALKPFAPLRGKTVVIDVDGDGVERQFRVTLAGSHGPVNPRPPVNVPGGRHFTPGANKQLSDEP